MTYTPGQATNLPTDRTTGTSPADHLDDHLTVHGAVNDLTVGRFGSYVGVPSGWWGCNPYTFGTANAAPSTTPFVSLLPLFVARRQQFSALGFQLTTLQVGGTVACSIGLYAETNGMLALTSAALIASGSIDLTSAGGAVGKRSISLGPRWLDVGMYWGAFQFNQTSTPSTAPQVTMSGNNGFNLPHPDANVIGQTVRNYRLTGVTALPTAGQSFSISGNPDGVVMELRAA